MKNADPIPGGGASPMAEAGENPEALGTFLRAHSPAPLLRNADFFNRSILDRIASETSPAPARRAPRANRPAFRFTFPRLAWGLCGAAACAAVLLGFQRFEARLAAPSGGPYFSKVHSAQPGDGAISAVAFQSRDQRIAVIWLDGLPYIPQPEERRRAN